MNGNVLLGSCALRIYSLIPQLPMPVGNNVLVRNTSLRSYMLIPQSPIYKGANGLTKSLSLTLAGYPLYDTTPPNNTLKGQIRYIRRK